MKYNQVKIKDRMLVIREGPLPKVRCSAQKHRTYLREHGLPEEGIKDTNPGNKENKIIYYKGRRQNLSEAHADLEQKLLLYFKQGLGSFVFVFVFVFKELNPLSKYLLFISLLSENPILPH